MYATISLTKCLSQSYCRSAILTAARGLKIDNDIAQYISSLIVADRGQLRTLSQMYYGDDDNPPVIWIQKSPRISFCLFSQWINLCDTKYI